MILSKECHERGCAAYDDRVDEGVVLTNGEEYMKAFPSTNETTDDRGMDLRDYFAAKFMHIAFKMVEHNYNLDFGSNYEWSYDKEEFESLADLAYGMADAMIKVRESR